MKLRVRSNSVRLRLSQSEVDKLATTGMVEEAVEFVPESLIYMVHSSTESTEINVSFRNGEITIGIPEARAKQWAAGTETGISGTFRGISVLIEKDWACLHADDRENEDTFPRPAS